MRFMINNALQMKMTMTMMMMMMMTTTTTTAMVMMMTAYLAEVVDEVRVDLEDDRL